MCTLSVSAAVFLITNAGAGVLARVEHLLRNMQTPIESMQDEVKGARNEINIMRSKLEKLVVATALVRY